MDLYNDRIRLILLNELLKKNIKDIDLEKFSDDIYINSYYLENIVNKFKNKVKIENDYIDIGYYPEENLDDFAYVSLLYPNKDGELTFFAGAILLSLSLQNSKIKKILMVTPDVDQYYIEILNMFFDEIKVVKYITFNRNEGEYIKINKNNFNSDISNNFLEEIHTNTKLHIFNKDLFNYKKVIFLDLDILVIKNFDYLFNLNAPAGCLEHKSKDNRRVWDRDIDLHGSKFSEDKTDISKDIGTTINCGILIVEPNIKIYKEIIDDLQNPNLFDTDFIERDYDLSKNKWEKKFYFPEQSYLTNKFKNKWHVIDNIYNCWDLMKEDSFGIHPIESKFNFHGTILKKKIWEMQMNSDSFYQRQVNNVFIKLYTQNKKVFNLVLKDLIFLIDDKFYNIREIKDDNYDKLLDDQKKLVNLIQK